MSDGVSPVDGGLVETTNGRRNVELRLLGLVGFCWSCTVLQALGWAFIGLDRERLIALPWVYLAVVQVAGIVVALGIVYSQMPTPRWPRRGSHMRLPNPVPLLLMGWPALVFVPLVFLRERRAGELTPEHVELGFRQLLGLPRTAGVAFLSCTGTAYVLDAFFVPSELALDRRSMAVLAV